MTETPTNYLPPSNFQSAGYPAWPVIDGNQSILDPTGTGDFGNLYVQNTVTAQQFAGPFGPLFYDPRFYGAVGNGTTDDTAAILAAITAMPVGATLDLSHAPVSYVVNQTINFKSGCQYIGKAPTYPAKIRSAAVPTQPDIIVKPGTSLATVISDGVWTGSASTPVASSGILIRGLCIDGTNIAGGTGNGITLLSQASTAEYCEVNNVPGIAVLFTNTNSAGHTTESSPSVATQDECGIYGCRIGSPGVSGIVIQYTTPGGTITDGYIINNIIDMNFSGTGVAMVVQNGADWRVEGNHIYAAPLGAYQLHDFSQGTIAWNRADNWGQNSAAATTYIGFDITVAPFGRTSIVGNRCYTKEAAGAGAGNFLYYQLGPNGNGQVNEVTWSDNACRQVTATTGTSTGYSFGSGTGASSMTVLGITSPLTVDSDGSLSAVPEISGTSVLFPDFVGPVQQAQPANPASTEETVPVMAGLAIELQPALTGAYLVTITGMAGTATATATVTMTGRYGTPYSAAPANGATETGTQFGVQQQAKAPALGEFTAFTITGLITGLTPGSPAWADLTYDTSAAADAASLENLQVIFQEVSS